jgi:two-component system, sensor histidine kinase and response regulator
MARILVIDDASELCALTVEVLRDEGYEADSAPDGAAGLRMAYQDPPDLVLCDLQMKGLDGYEVLASLRRDPRTALIPVIFLTGMGGSGAVRHGMNLGADDYLIKPVPNAMLLRAVQARLDRSQSVRNEAAQRLTDLRKELARSLLPHELLTPLTAVMVLASLLTEEGAVEAGQVKEVAAGILQGATDLETKITKFLLYAEIQTLPAAEEPRPTRGTIGVPEAVRAKAAGVGREADIEIDVAAFRSPMSGDHLQALVQELVENALKFSQPGTAVTIRGGCDGEGCLLSVKDRGRGMTPEQLGGLERAPFLRRHQEQPGLGMGLSIVRKLALVYGADVSFETAVGHGTTVHIRFPKRTSAA